MSETRHRLLEGVLLRIANLPDAGGLALRGGMLLRNWFRPVPRPTPDLDLVAPSPAAAEAARGSLSLFTDETIQDGVAFDGGHIQVERIWVHTENPGLRIHVCGRVAGREHHVKVDITGGPPSRPGPILGELPTALGRSARIWMCRPEAVAGQKVQALCHLGMLSWRPKDLDDLRLLFDRVPINPESLKMGVSAYISDMGWTLEEAHYALNDQSWWGSKHAAARWSDFVDSVRGREVPPDLPCVVSEVRRGLASIWESMA